MPAVTLGGLILDLSPSLLSRDVRQ